MPSLFGMTPARSSTLLPFALLILMIPPFLADMALPLGMSVWVLYLLPLTLSYMTSRAIIPPLLAVTATLLMAIGYQIAPAGVDPTVLWQKWPSSHAQGSVRPVASLHVPAAHGMGPLTTSSGQ